MVLTMTMDPEAGAEVWFRDLEGRWGFLADSFSNYYRMMIAHLGIISWQVCSRL
jgi:hypothetical protein